MIDIHKSCTNNAVEIKESAVCGCFYCCKVIQSEDVNRYFLENDGGRTGMCPNCHIDSLLPNITDLDLLKEVHEKRFK